MTEQSSSPLFAVAAEAYDRLMGRYLPTLGVAFADAAGAFTLEAHAWCAVGRVPG